MDNFPNWVAPVVASLFGASVVALANFLVQRWRYLADRLGTSIDKLCDEINSAAQCATDYWLLDMTQRDDVRLGQKLEPILIGRQQRIQQLLLALAARDRKLDLSPIQPLQLNLFDAMTGRNFRVGNRPPQPDLAQEVQGVAAALNGELHRALAKRNRGCC